MVSEISITLLATRLPGDLMGKGVREKPFNVIRFSLPQSVRESVDAASLTAVISAASALTVSASHLIQPIKQTSIIEIYILSE